MSEWMTERMTAATAETKAQTAEEQMMVQESKKNVSGLALVYSAAVTARKPVQRVVAGVREGSTGRVVQRMWAVGCEPVQEAAAPKPRPKPELAFYRKYTEAMLRRYLRMATESGRVPSMLGRELFRSKVTSYKVQSFEDVVIFCFDMERCLGKLTEGEREVIKRVALQEYTHGETAMMMGLSLRAVVMKYGQALDRLTGILLAAKLMEPQGGRG
ncbi:MAG: sigma factor-like helix-turn-helix DNA-binding protein [Acidobacteriaceae bacterium]|nr:sigma factor-like helix-turn-helix DNA-binding protein [Acidobacteriaceae bacterium]